VVKPGWLKIQRVGLFLYLTFGILLLVYALSYITDIYIFYAYGSKALVDFYSDMQKINTGLLWKAILVIIFSLVMFILQLAKHPAGLITLVVVVVIAAFSILMCIDTFVLLAEARHNYINLDLSSLNRYIERGAIKYQFSTLTWDLGLGGYALFLLSSLFLAAVVMRNAFVVRETVREDKNI
jgi:hypothetical protein